MSSADCGTVTVSVEVAELAPGVTDVGSREHVSNAVGGVATSGVTAQDSWTAVVNDAPGWPRGVMVTMSVTCPPRCAVKFTDAG